MSRRLEAWVLSARALGASDVHVEAGTVPVARIQGELRAFGETVSEAQLIEALQEPLGNEGWEQYLARGSADLSADIAGTRCRLNLYKTVRGVAMALRLLMASANDLRACNLHPDLGHLINARAGLVIVCGPTGSGKSTTLAALVEEMNSSRAWNVVSLESPIEYLFTNRRSFVRQREIPTHSPSYEQAIHDALRENPDALVIGEMRSPEIMRQTLNAAETGHLVLTTMHSASCAEALSRLCMSFAAEIQSSIRAQLADCLVGVVCQRLELLSESHLLVPRCEILTASSASKGTIRSGQFSQIATVLQSGGEDGMWTFDRYRRWMAQKTDWVLAPAKPRAATAVHTSPSPLERAAPPLQRPVRPMRQPPPELRATRVPTPTSAAKLAPTPSPSDDIQAPFEYTIDEPTDLKELLKKIDSSTP